MSAIEARRWFDFGGGVLLFCLGVALIVKHFFISGVPSGYEFIFGAQFITAGVLLAHGRLKQFKESRANVDHPESSRLLKNCRFRSSPFPT